MLEKLGLPIKPSLRGSSWVVDASHCQGCSSQFTFINRKHHCRRCGGLFCNGCTQQRMILRGQGDSPVRICEPCKKLEEAARFEMRHGYRNRTSKGSSKTTAKSEDEVLSQIPGDDANESSSKSSSCLNDAGSATYYTATELQNESESADPEELRKQALEEKKKYKILKAEGKPEEALRALKRGKELERQADARDIAMTRNRRKAMSLHIDSEEQSARSIKESSKRVKSLHESGKETDGFAAELRALGWSDDEDKKTSALSLEGEFSSLLREIPDRTNKEKGHRLDKTQVNALKKKALILKREGKLVEAKEELKKAKILEKQLEEEELLAGAEDSDDELSSIIHSMDDDHKDGLYDLGDDFDVDHLMGIVDDLGVSGEFEVTDKDMMDPEIAAILTSLGWTEESDQSEFVMHEPAQVDRVGKLAEIQSLKREALNKKREGSASEAMALLKKAKLLERELEGLNTESAGATTKSAYITNEIVYANKATDSKQAPKNKLTIQKELLAIKKKALALRREGRLEEAEQELKKGKIFQDQLDELDNPAKAEATPVTSGNVRRDMTYKNPGVPGVSLIDEDVDVTDQDLHDPGYLSLLRNLGWDGESNKPVDCSSRPVKLASHSTEVRETQDSHKVSVIVPKRSRAEMQRELLGIKRKALPLQRQGNVEVADKILETASTFEAQMAEIEAPKDILAALCKVKRKPTDPAVRSVFDETNEDVKEKDMHDPELLSVLKNLGWEDEELEPEADAANTVKQTADNIQPSSLSSGPKSKAELQRQLLGLKRKALALRRKGETEKADEMRKEATVLEAQIAEEEALKSEHDLDASVQGKFGNSKLLIDEEYIHLNNELHRNKSTTLRLNCHSAFDDKSLAPSGRSGSKSADRSLPSSSEPAEDTHFLSYSNLSTQMGVPSSFVIAKGGSATHAVQPVNGVDLLKGDSWSKPQTSAEKLENKINLDSGCLVSPIGEPQRSGSHAADKIEMSQNNHDTLRQEILALKKGAVALKKEGKLAEARAELRKAKLLERSLLEDSPPQKTSRDDAASKPCAALMGHKENGASNLAPKPLITRQKEDSLSNLAPKPVLTGQKEDSSSKLAAKPLSGRDRFKLQQESLSHKRQALKLRREGRLQEAEAESEIAKALEAQLEESSGQVSRPELVDDVVVEDLLDPQLLSALKAIGLDNVNNMQPNPEKHVASKASPSDALQAAGNSEIPKPSASKSESPNQERVQLEERIKAEKMKAVNLKRAGKQAEALDAFRRAKLYEKKLKSLAAN